MSPLSCFPGSTMAWGNLSWKFSFGEICASFPGKPDEGIAGAPQQLCFLFTMWVLDSGCENPFSFCGDKGERVAGFSADAKGSFTELPARTPIWPYCARDTFTSIVYLRCFIFICSRFQCGAGPREAPALLRDRDVRSALRPTKCQPAAGRGGRALAHQGTACFLTSLCPHHLSGQAAGWGQQQMSPGLSAGCSVLH